MATQNRETLSKNSGLNPAEVLDTLKSLFGDVLEVEIIKSIAQTYNYNLETTSNILAELTANLSNDTIVSKKSKNISSNINSVAYAAAGDDDNNVDVYIESVNKFDYKQAVQQGNRNKNVNPKKVVPTKQVQTKPVQNKSKRELEYDRVREHIVTGAKVCILLRGLPGSGKTHLARMIVQTTINEDCRRFIFSTDEFFERNGVYNYNPLLLNDAHVWNQKRVYEAMHLGISPVVIDNTNTQMWEMKIYAAYAVQFGYAVEILEPMTVWIFNPPELTRRNIHNVPRNKIVDMLDRYEKNITPERLFSMFNLKYSPRNHPPQPRLYPPLSRNIRPLMAPKPLFNIPPSIAKYPNNNAPNKNVNQNQPKPKKKRVKKKKQEDNSNNGIIRKSESMHSILTNDDSDDESEIDSLNELQRTDSGYCLNVREAFYDKRETNTKQSNQYELVNLDDNIHQKNYSKQSADMDLINFDFDDDSTNKYSTDLIGLDNNKAAANSTNVSNVHEKTQLLIDSCVKLFKAVTTKDNSEVDKNLSKTTDYPKIDLSSWGLRDDTFASWEVVDKSKEESKNDPQPQRQIARQVSEKSQSNPNEIGTNTTSEDFALLKQDFVDNSEIRVIATISRNIGENCVNHILRNPSRVSMFDKSTMTGKENVLSAALARSRCSNEDQHFHELVKLFPNKGVDSLKDIFEKCQGDVNWAVDLLLDENKDLDEKISEEIGNVASNHTHSSECDCTINMQPEIYIPQESVIAPTNLTPEIKRSPTRLKNKTSEESLLLKKQIEEQFRIDDTYYSNHVSNIRRKRYGEQEPTPSTSKDQYCVSSEDTDNNFEEFEASEESSEEEVIEMNVGINFIDQLERNCGNPDMDYPEGFQPVMQLPTSLVRLLHAYWIESLYQQMDNHSSILETMLKEDEEFARKLQEQEAVQQNSSTVVPNLQEIMDMEIALAIYKADQEQWKKETPDDLASRMKRQKLFETFPNFDRGALVEIMQSCNNSFDETVEVLKLSMDVPDKNSSIDLDKQNELLEKAKQEYIEAKKNEAKSPKIVVKGDNVDEDDGACCSAEKTATQYREEAAHHLKMRQTCFTKAQAAIQKGLTQVAVYYSEIAQMHKQRYEQANNLAATSFLTSHSKFQNSRTLDLHFLYVKEAEQALAMFLDKHVSMLKAKNKPRETLYVITGRGSHSKDGISHIKPVVKRLLKDRNLNFVQMNPGLLKIIVNKHSIMTNDLK